MDGPLTRELSNECYVPSGSTCGSDDGPMYGVYSTSIETQASTTELPATEATYQVTGATYFSQCSSVSAFLHSSTPPTAPLSSTFQ